MVVGCGGRGVMGRKCVTSITTCSIFDAEMFEKSIPKIIKHARNHNKCISVRFVSVSDPNQYQT